MPATISLRRVRFCTAPNTLAEQLVRQWTTLGMSQKEAIGQVGIDSVTLARWERGEREPVGCSAEFLRMRTHRAVRRAG